MLRTREEMPVVATVDLLAASGAYYAAAAADEILRQTHLQRGQRGRHRLFARRRVLLKKIC
ncbi:MAG: S49 family peptidase [Chloroflexi bacterium]|nr:S49 family peptidase [Chloroflexota bacterium]